MVNRATFFASVALAATTMWSGCSPYGGGSFTCTSDEQCVGQGMTGMCEPNSFCSFADTACPSGRSYGDLSGSLSHTCVGQETPDAAVHDTSSDVPINVVDALSCYGGGLATYCFNTPLSGTMTLPLAINTDTAAICSMLFTGECVIAAGDLTVPSGTLAVTGGKPLVLVAGTTLTVTGTIDVASHRNPAQLGAAADSASCNAGTAPTGSGGGAGGSFGGAGGDGGGGGARGVAGAVGAATTLRGGCRGQPGSGSTGGHGGGVVYLIAGTSITVSGAINASGAGAAGGVGASTGAGGGGSGGLIALDSPMVTATGGQIFANGGGGGEGGSMGGNTGDFGKEPTTPGTVAGGGTGGSTSGGDGGAGAAGATITGVIGASGTASGGGGGGGAGVVKLFKAATITGGAVSPSPS